MDAFDKTVGGVLLSPCTITVPEMDTPLERSTIADGSAMNRNGRPIMTLVVKNRRPLSKPSGAGLIDETAWEQKKR
jgi:hypothetical protein